MVCEGPYEKPLCSVVRQKFESREKLICKAFDGSIIKIAAATNREWYNQFDYEKIFYHTNPAETRKLSVQRFRATLDCLKRR
jgi:hypothetical protein